MPYTGYSQQPAAAPMSGVSGGTSQDVRSPAAPMAGVPGGTTAPDAQTPQGSDALQSLWQLLQPYLAGADAGTQQQISAIMQQQGFANQQQGLSTDAANQAQQFALQHLGVQQGQLGIEQGANERQASLLPQLHDLALQGFTQQEQESWQGAQARQQDLNSALGARGAYTSEGGNTQRGRIQQGLANSLETIGRERDQSNLQFNEQIAQNSDAKKQLDLMKQNLGIDANEINSRLQNTLAQLGLSGKMTTAQLLGELGKVQSGQYSPISQIVGDIYSISGLQIPAGG